MLLLQNSSFDPYQCLTIFEMKRVWFINGINILRLSLAIPLLNGTKTTKVGDLSSYYRQVGLKFAEIQFSGLLSPNPTCGAKLQLGL